jgi:hypothetical protein
LNLTDEKDSFSKKCWILNSFNCVFEDTFSIALFS